MGSGISKLSKQNTTRTKSKKRKRQMAKNCQLIRFSKLDESGIDITNGNKESGSGVTKGDEGRGNSSTKGDEKSGSAITNRDTEIGSTTAKGDEVSGSATTNEDNESCSAKTKGDEVSSSVTSNEDKESGSAKTKGDEVSSSATINEDKESGSAKTKGDEVSSSATTNEEKESGSAKTKGDEVSSSATTNEDNESCSAKTKGGAENDNASINGGNKSGSATTNGGSESDRATTNRDEECGSAKTNTDKESERKTNTDKESEKIVKENTESTHLVNPDTVQSGLINEKCNQDDDSTYQQPGENSYTSTKLCDSHNNEFWGDGTTRKEPTYERMNEREITDNRNDNDNDTTKSATTKLKGDLDNEHESGSKSGNENQQALVDTNAMEPSDEKETDMHGNSTSKEAAETESDFQFNDNVLFYRNEICSRPFMGETIEEMLKWKGDYVKLEWSHSYIQWLFPIPESRGMNMSAQPLQEHEARIIREDETLRARVLEAYKMMLDFYGMRLSDEQTGDVERGENHEDRYAHLERSVHNRFRITRILKALGELGFEHFQMPLVKFMIYEATTYKKLPSLNGNSMQHWIAAINDEARQGEMYHLLADLNEQLNELSAGSANQNNVYKGNSKQAPANEIDKTSINKNINSGGNRDIDENKVMENSKVDVEDATMSTDGNASGTLKSSEKENGEIGETKEMELSGTKEDVCEEHIPRKDPKNTGGENLDRAVCMENEYHEEDETSNPKDNKPKMKNDVDNSETNTMYVTYV